MNSIKNLLPLVLIVVIGCQEIKDQAQGTTNKKSQNNNSELAITANRVSATTSNFVCPPCGCSYDDSVYHQTGTCPGCGMGLVNKSKRINVALFVFDGMEILDFAGPAEVFASATSPEGWFHIYTVAVSSEPVLSQGFVSITPQYTLQNAPPADVVVLPGGGVGESVSDTAVINWVKKASRSWQVGLSVCNGAFIMAETGLLSGKHATTFHGLIDQFEDNYPDINVLRETRYVDNGDIVTTAGVSAGIDGSLHVVSKILGKEAAKSTVEYMEYDGWVPDNGLIIASGVENNQK